MGKFSEVNPHGTDMEGTPAIDQARRSEPTGGIQNEGAVRGGAAVGEVGLITTST
jgi:hypothetical protein